MSKDIKKALEHCIEWNCADCPNREELGSGETVCRGRLLPYVLEYVADLEAKLAEAQKTIEIQRMSNDALIDENLDYRYDITDSAYEQAKYMAESWEEDYQQEIAELKQQLAEKEKERLDTWKDYKYYKNRCLALEESLNENALNVLEKVKELLLIESKEYPIVYKISDDIVGGAIDKDKCFKIINNQIKELKG